MKSYAQFLNEKYDDFKKIESIFMEIYNKVKNQPFNNDIIVLDSDELYKKIGRKSSAAMRRKIFFGKNKIWIRRMEDYEMLYELSHEVGHTLKPNLERYYESAEEIKAILFQYCFVNEFKKLNINVPNFEKFVEWRIDWIMKNDEKYSKYYEIAKYISEMSNFNFDKGCELILDRIKKSYKI